MIATSKALIDRAIEAHAEGGENLARDEEYRSICERLGKKPGTPGLYYHIRPNLGTDQAGSAGRTRTVLQNLGGENAGLIAGFVRPEKEKRYLCESTLLLGEGREEFLPWLGRTAGHSFTMGRAQDYVPTDAILFVGVHLDLGDLFARTGGRRLRQYGPEDFVTALDRLEFDPLVDSTRGLRFFDRLLARPFGDMWALPEIAKTSELQEKVLRHLDGNVAIITMIGGGGTDYLVVANVLRSAQDSDDLRRGISFLKKHAEDKVTIGERPLQGHHLWFVERGGSKHARSQPEQDAGLTIALSDRRDVLLIASSYRAMLKALSQSRLPRATGIWGAGPVIGDFRNYMPQKVSGIFYVNMRSWIEALRDDIIPEEYARLSLAGESATGRAGTPARGQREAARAIGLKAARDFLALLRDERDERLDPFLSWVQVEENALLFGSRGYATPFFFQVFQTMLSAATRTSGETRSTTAARCEMNHRRIFLALQLYATANWHFPANIGNIVARDYLDPEMINLFEGPEPTGRITTVEDIARHSVYGYVPYPNRPERLRSDLIMLYDKPEAHGRRRRGRGGAAEEGLHALQVNGRFYCVDTRPGEYRLPTWLEIRKRLLSQPIPEELREELREELKREQAREQLR